MLQVKFGLIVPTFPADGINEKEFVNQIRRSLREVEDGFDSAWVGDHFVPYLFSVPRTTPTLEGFTTISHLSGEFRRLLFGNIVLCNSYRNPALLAKMGATLQTLTGGRFILGIGAGWNRDEYMAYGYEFPSTKARIQQLEEGVQIIKDMWIKGVATFKGRYYNVDEAYCHPTPDPAPPIMIGGKGEKLTLKVVARHADWWNTINLSPETYKHKREVLKGHCKKEGRDYSEIVKTYATLVAIAKTGREARNLASKSKITQIGNVENYIIGDPVAVTERLKEYTELGVEHIILRFVDFPTIDGIKLFASKVIPAFTHKTQK